MIKIAGSFKEYLPLMDICVYYCVLY